MVFWIKYGTQSDIRFPMVKRGVVDLAVSADWTPAAADSAISKDGGNYADTTNTVAIVGGTPTRSVAGWKITISSTEAQAAELNIQIVDAATKAVEDQFLTVYTYGNASAKFAGDWSDLVRLGLTSLPNVASGSAGAIPTTGTGANQISVSSGQVILQTGTGTGQLDFTSGVVKANLAQILGTALTETAGQIAAAFKKFFNVATPSGTVNSIPDATAGAAGGLFIAGTNAATTVTTALTTTFTGNLTGSVASVTSPVAITSNVKQNQALAGFEFLMTDSTNHAPATGKAVSVTRSIDGGAFAAGTLSAVTEVSNGIYSVDFGAGDLNGKTVILRATAAGCDDTFERISTQV